MDSTISKWYGDLLHDLLLYGTAERTFAVIGKVKFTSTGSIGDFVMEFPDGTKWYSTEQSRRADGTRPAIYESILLSKLSLRKALEGSKRQSAV